MQEDFNRTVSRTIAQRRDAIADAITDRQYEAYPQLAARYGPVGRVRCREDAGYHLSYLAEAIANSLPSLFADYVRWAKVMLAGRGIPADDLAANLRFLRDAIRTDLPAEMADLATGYVESALEDMAQGPSALAADEDSSEPMAELSARYLAALLAADRREASRLVLEAVENGADIADIYLNVFQRTQHQIGRLWQMNRLSVAQEHYCTAATQMIMSQLYPRIFSTERRGRTMVAACIGGDLHEIGVRMIADFFEMAGWDTIYLGANVPVGNIVDMLIARRASLLAVSATMTFHVGQMAELIAAIRANPACAGVKILVGGYPFNIAPDLWKRIGADAFARDARGSVEVAERLMAGEIFQ